MFLYVHGFKTWKANFLDTSNNWLIFKTSFVYALGEIWSLPQSPQILNVKPGFNPNVSPKCLLGYTQGTVH